VSVTEYACGRRCGDPYRLLRCQATGYYVLHTFSFFVCVTTSTSVMLYLGLRGVTLAHTGAIWRHHVPGARAGTADVRCGVGDDGCTRAGGGTTAHGRVGHGSGRCQLDDEVRHCVAPLPTRPALSFSGMPQFRAEVVRRHASIPPTMLVRLALHPPPPAPSHRQSAACIAGGKLGCTLWWQHRGDSRTC
jgi:hypothetical protein